MDLRIGVAVGLVAFAACSVAGGPPATERRVVTDEYHGTRVADAYRWLESWDDPAVRAWSDAQNTHARSVLDGLPNVAAIRDEVGAIMRSGSPHYTDLTWRAGGGFSDGNLYFAMKSDPSRQQSMLVLLGSIDDAAGERVILDPNVLDPTGSTTIDWYVPSPDGGLVAVSLSEGGSERGDLHVYHTATGRPTGETIAHVNGGTAGGSLAWLPDSSGFLYTRYPRAGERDSDDLDFYQQLWMHRLGTALSEDTPELTELPRIAEIQVRADGGMGRFLVTVQDGDSGRFKHAVRDASGQWTWFTKFGDGHAHVFFGVRHDVYVISYADAPRGRLLRVTAVDPEMSAAMEVVGETEATIVSEFWSPEVALATRERVFLTYQLGGPSEIRAFTHDGRSAAMPEQAPVSSVSHVVEGPDESVLFHLRSYVDPGAWYRFDAKTGETAKTGLVRESTVNFDDCRVRREFAVSKDGTRVPVNILMPKRVKRDGNNPLMLTGYGGYGISLEPRFGAANRVWLDRGGIVCVANLRGGGEFGDGWHRDGNLTKKQNVFDDFAAVMQHVMDMGYTSPDRLAIVGGSNGGLLMGAMVTQHPDLFAATVSFVGLYDMLRSELSPNGAFNIPEFGTVTDEVQYRAMRAYSPYHRVEKGTEYPAVLFMTGANDPRVDPMHSRKMTAMLQWANGSKTPVLLRTSSDTGHGGGTPLDERIEQRTDQFAFLFNALGVDVK